MKWIKLFEDFKNNNEEGNLITIDDVIDCIKNNGFIYTKIIKDLPNNDPDESLKALSVDNDGVVTIEYDNNEYEVDIKNISKLEY